MLARLRDWCTRHGVLLILDEVMTGFGRTGTLFACEREGIAPDFMALAKGLTGGYLPLAATVTTEEIFDTFRGTVAERKTFYYGHSYTANALGCAAALGSLRVFREEQVLERLQPKIAFLKEELRVLEALPHVVEVRQCGFVAAVEVAGADGHPFPTGAQTGAKVCLAARAHGLLTRPIGDSVVLMLPLCVSEEEIARACRAIAAGIGEQSGRDFSP
jgi:adenosylmethionine-8-amino-7-oxononanoate aminotransferase